MSEVDIQSEPLTLDDSQIKLLGCLSLAEHYAITEQGLPDESAMADEVIVARQRINFPSMRPDMYFDFYETLSVIKSSIHEIRRSRSHREPVYATTAQA